MFVDDLRSIFKISYEEISEEAGSTVVTVHNYFSKKTNVRVGSVQKIEQAVIDISRNRIERGNKILEGINE